MRSTSPEDASSHKTTLKLILYCTMVTLSTRVLGSWSHPGTIGYRREIAVSHVTRTKGLSCSSSLKTHREETYRHHSSLVSPAFWQLRVGNCRV